MLAPEAVGVEKVGEPTVCEADEGRSINGGFDVEEREEFPGEDVVQEREEFPGEDFLERKLAGDSGANKDAPALRTEPRVDDKREETLEALCGRLRGNVRGSGSVSEASPSFGTSKRIFGVTHGPSSDCSVNKSGLSGLNCKATSSCFRASS